MEAPGVWAESGVLFEGRALGEAGQISEVLAGFVGTE